jgi:predicted TIM-barrel fold metal-dependent hydrolase
MNGFAMIIDFHTHCFLPKIAERAMPQLAARSGSRTPYYDGTPSGLVEISERCGIDFAVVQNIATNPRQQSAVNSFAISLLAIPGLIPFGSVHPDAPDVSAELQRLKNAGIKGIKLHPDYQGYFSNEKRLFPFYQTIAEMGFVTLFHAGVDIGLPDPVHNTPEMLAEALPAFSGAPVVAAHFGGYMCWKDVVKYLSNTQLYLDTSYSARKLPPPWAREIAQAFGSERLLFGTDLPWSDPLDELAYVRELGFDAANTQAILGGNAAKLLGL